MKKKYLDGLQNNLLNYRSLAFYDFVSSTPNAYLCERGRSVDSILNDNRSIIWSPCGTINLQAFLQGTEVNFLDTYSPYKLLNFVIFRENLAIFLQKTVRVWPRLSVPA